MGTQGWDRADFHCGRCGNHAFTAATEAEYIRQWQLHATAHDVAAALLDGPEEIREQVFKLIGLTL